MNVAPPPSAGRWLFRYAVLTALCTLVLVCLGGLVTSKQVGMSVPDWPTSYGYNMLALPINTWFTGGIFEEHTHRLLATAVGILVVGLTRWLGGHAARRPLLIIGLLELVTGFLLLRVGPDWKGAGYFLSGIGGVVVLAGLVWTRNSPASGSLPPLGWLAFTLVQVQGLLGGLRVVLDREIVADTTLGTVFGLAHACLGQGFFVLLCVIALLLSPLWLRMGRAAKGFRSDTLAWLLPVTTGIIFLQLVLGALMRHQHAGLAIHDFPLAYGSLWPATDPATLAHYNQLRTEDVPVTAFQIFLQMFHRLGALLIVGLVTASFLSVRRNAVGTVLTPGANLWLGLIIAQFFLGAATIWTDKAADIATAHVAIGALSLATGTLLTLAARRIALPVRSGVEGETRSAAVFAKPFVR
ncbi:MAG TPA: COX15/CtaA family protein [Candidatus Limnocylindria bacterium]|nr:COX15/CtaA family protein [Candidatus Limnocylindria bacterium]